MDKLRHLAHYQFIYAIFSILLEFNLKRLNFGKIITPLLLQTSRRYAMQLSLHYRVKHGDNEQDKLYSFNEKKNTPWIVIRRNTTMTFLYVTRKLLCCLNVTENVLFRFKLEKL